MVLFFVLSGFVLTGALVRLPRYSGSNATQFVVSRLFRIYPAVFATIAIFAALLLVNGALDWSRDFVVLLKNALLIDTSVDVVMWSLQIELIAIPVILIVYLGWQRWGPIAVAVALAILLPLAFSVRWNALIPGQIQLRPDRRIRVWHGGVPVCSPPDSALVAGALGRNPGRLDGGLPHQPRCLRAVFAMVVAF